MAPERLHDAPGLLAGTELQFIRALYWLAEAPAGATVGIETGDDVVTVDKDGTLSREQDKNTIAETDPITERSVQLWKTLAIWVEEEVRGHLSERNALILCTNRIVPQERLIVSIELMNRTTSRRQRDAQLNQLMLRPNR